MSFEVCLHGSRGSIPTAGESTLRYGGNTTCLESRLSDRHRLLIDCGSGLRHVDVPASTDEQALRFDILMTHYHLDHLEGLPFFPALYDKRARFRFHGPTLEGVGVEAVLTGLFRPPWFPVSFVDTPCRKEFIDLDGTPLSIGGLEISYTLQPHPQGALAFRLESGGRALVFATDVERSSPERNAELDRFAKGAGALIHDAQYTPDERIAHSGWGHSTWRQAIEAARNCGAERLLLFHHAPDRNDDQIDEIVAAARTEFPAVEAARDGLIVRV